MHTDLFPKMNERIGFCMTIQTSNDLDNYDLTELVDDPEQLWFQNFTTADSPNSSTTPRSEPWQHCLAGLWNGETMTTTRLNNWKTFAGNNPGRKWLFVNEPDVYSQGRKTPQTYAEEYYDFYYGMKDADSTCKIYAGGLSQGSPQRIRWLDEMVYHYETEFEEGFPCDGFHIHGYSLPDDSPGVGRAYGVSDPDSDPNVANATENAAWWNTYKPVSLSVFQEYMYNMRFWMFNNGFREKPLIVSEYGSLSDYGSYGIETYLEQTIEWAIDAVDLIIGCPEDGFRMIQEIAWFCINYHVNSTDQFPHSWLFNRVSPYSIRSLGTKYYNTVNPINKRKFIHLPSGLELQGPGGIILERV